MDPNPGLDENTPREHDETQASFRQASAVLEAAHRRITLLRQSLLDLTESIPALGAQPTASVRPPHDAILLSGPSNEEQDSNPPVDMSRVRSALPPSVMDRLQQFEAEYLGDAQPTTTPENITLPPAPSGTTIRQLPPLRGAIITVNSPAQPPARSWLDNQLSLRRETANPDDPSTVLGRRVAARESRTDSRQIANTAYATIPQLQQILLDSTATIARNLENLNNSLLQRVQNPDSAPSSRPELIPIHTTVSADGRLRRSLQASNGRSTQSPVGVNAAQISSSPSLFASRPPPNRRIRNVMRADSVRQASGSPAQSPLGTSSSGQSANGARLSVLSNFTVDNLSTPVTPSPNERPILFDEPDSYVLQATLVEPPPEPSRGYFIRRRVNPDGDELIHNVFWNDSFDDPISSASPRQLPEVIPYRWSTPSTIRPSQRMESNQDMWPPLNRLPQEAPRRRRGWARLDADGNEIPIDEEDQLERLRAEHRIRAQQQSRAAAASQTEASSPAQPQPPVTTGAAAATAAGQNHAPPSRVITAAGELDATIALVRSNRREVGMLTNALDSVVSFDRSRRFSSSQLGLSSTLSNVETSAPDSPEMYGSSEPFFVDPLPMPLSLMVPTAPKKMVGREKKHDGGVDVGCVPKHASWAGR